MTMQNDFGARTEIHLAAPAPRHDPGFPPPS